MIRAGISKESFGYGGPNCWLDEEDSPGKTSALNESYTLQCLRQRENVMCIVAVWALARVATAQTALCNLSGAKCRRTLVSTQMVHLRTCTVASDIKEHQFSLALQSSRSDQLMRACHANLVLDTCPARHYSTPSALRLGPPL